MRYFKHHIGDYAAATRHLSFVEDAAYRRLMDHYYATEKPLLSDLKGLVRVVGARTKDEKAAVETVLQEFFTLESDGWHQRRCDAELDRHREKSLKASEAGKRGGRPRAEAKPLENQETPKANASLPESVRTPTEKLTTTHQPLPINHEEVQAAAAPSGSARATDDMRPPPALDRSVDQAFALFQIASKDHGWPEVMFLNSVRRSLLQGRLADAGGLEGWKAALEAASKAEFLYAPDGKPHGWFDLDWMLQADKFTRLMEGRYDQRRNATGQNTGLGANLEALAEFGRTGTG